MAEDNKDYTKSNHAADKKAEDERSTQNNANNIRNAADVAIASKNPYAMAAGAAVKAADKITGGKSTEALGKGMTKANKMAPGGKKIQNASNKLNESGASDKIGTAARMKSGGAGGGAGAASNAGNAANAADNAQKAQQAQQAADKAKQAQDAANKAQNSANNSGGGQKGSLPSSGSKKGAPSSGGSGGDSSDEEGSKKGGLGKFLLKQALISTLIIAGPFLIIILLLFCALALISGVFGEFDDAMGMSQTLGEETGDIDYDASSEEQQAFYDRVNNVKLSYQAEGKNVDAMKIIAIFHVLQRNGADIDYDNVSESTIRSWADAMFKDGVYDEETFRNNLINSIFPKYLPKSTTELREEMADEVFQYIEDYNDFIGKDTSQSNSCGSIGSCTYDVKGFSYDGTNVSKNMSISNLKVRLMQCEPPYGNGSYTTPVSNELVDFENYVAGVAYAEVGDGAPIEQYKTQMVAARSFALSRPTSMGNSRGLKLEQENGQWILQISSCVADQVYCNIDKGCHDEGGGSEGGYTVDGDDPSAWYHKPALPEGHDIRKAAEATQGEVLVNGQGYIINTGFLMTEQNLWASLAKQGLNYKQILMKTYGSGGIRSSGATDIKKASCSGGGGTCATGEFTTWRQGDPQWSSTPMGTSGSTLGQIGCLVTSVSIQMARSGVQININPFNPGTFVEFLNKNGGIASGGNFVWASPQQAAPTFVYQGQEYILGLSKEEKLNKINSLVSQKGVYVVAEVKGNTGQHWVAVMGVNGSSVEMVDPASDATDMWSQYNWANTSVLAYYKAG